MFVNLPKILLSWKFPRETALWTIIPCLTPIPNPLQNAKLFLNCRLGVSEKSKHHISWPTSPTPFLKPSEIVLFLHRIFYWKVKTECRPDQLFNRDLKSMTDRDVTGLYTFLSTQKLGHFLHIFGGEKENQETQCLRLELLLFPGPWGHSLLNYTDKLERRERHQLENIQCAAKGGKQKGIGHFFSVSITFLVPILSLFGHSFGCPPEGKGYSKSPEKTFSRNFRLLSPLVSLRIAIGKKNRCFHIAKCKSQVLLQKGGRKRE